MTNGFSCYSYGFGDLRTISPSTSSQDFVLTIPEPAEKTTPPPTKTHTHTQTQSTSP